MIMTLATVSGVAEEANDRGAEAGMISITGLRFKDNLEVIPG
jgi:hypothetical protein